MAEKMRGETPPEASVEKIGVFLRGEIHRLGGEIATTVRDFVKIGSGTKEEKLRVLNEVLDSAITDINETRERYSKQLTKEE